MQKVTVVEARTEERPFFYEFKKWEVVGQHPTMANLNYDPFPDKQSEDVVRREILCTELVLYAKLQGEDVFHYRPGVAVTISGHTFAIKEAEIDISNNTCEIEGSEFQSECEPSKVLAQIRKTLATNNVK